jgi:ribonuclease Z
MKKVLWVVVVAMLILTAAWVGRDRLLEVVMRQRIDQTLTRVDQSLLTDGKLHVILCGTAAALPDPNRAGPCTAILANGEFWLIDAGPGSWRVLDGMNLPIGQLNGILVTHLHSDHIGEIGEANTQSWIAGRKQPLELYGPHGLNEVAAGFRQVYAHDTQYRIAHHNPEYLPPAGSEDLAHEIETPEGLNTVPVFERNGLRVSAFRVDHAPVDIAFGYRIEYRGRVVVISGDTRKSPAVIHNAQNADLLIHEALAATMTTRASTRARELGMTRLAKLVNDVKGYHTTPVEAAESAAEAHAKKLVLTHIFPPLPNRVAKYLFLAGTHEAYAGPIVLGEDRLRIDLDPIGAQP